jgi:hypothetical protein
MTDNILPFDQIESQRQLGVLQAGLPRVILEGGDDVDFFESWFIHMLDRLEFVEADDVIRGAGCTAVAPAVEYSRSNDGVPAIGIIDRDALFRNADWQNLFSTDDVAFAALQTADVTIASLWEIEAYLLRPELMADWVGLRSSVMPAPDERARGAIAAAIEECEALLDLSPTLAAAHAQGIPVGDGWGLHHNYAALAAACAHHFAAAINAQPALVTEVQQLVEAIRAVAPTPLPERLLFLLRYVNTKRLLPRLRERLSLYPNSHWALGKLMSMQTLRPSELEAIVTEHAQRHAA